MFNLADELDELTRSLIYALTERQPSGNIIPTNLCVTFSYRTGDSLADETLVVRRDYLQNGPVNVTILQAQESLHYEPDVMVPDMLFDSSNNVCLQ